MRVRGGCSTPRGTPLSASVSHRPSASCKPLNVRGLPRWLGPCRAKDSLTRRKYGRAKAPSPRRDRAMIWVFVWLLVSGETHFSDEHPTHHTCEAARAPCDTLGTHTH